MHYAQKKNFRLKNDSKTYKGDLPSMLSAHPLFLIDTVIQNLSFGILIYLVTIF